MPKEIKEKTLGQIKGDIKKGQESAEEIEKTYEEAVKKPKPIMTWTDFIIVIFCIILLAFSVVERSRVISLISGIALILILIKISIDNKGGN